MPVEISENLDASNGRLQTVLPQFTDNSASLVINNNRIEVSAADVSTYGVHDTALSSADHFAETLCQPGNVEYTGTGVVVRASSDPASLDGYRCELAYYTGVHNVEIARLDAGSSTTVASASLGTSDDLQHTLRVHVTGNTIEMYVDGVLRLTYTGATSHTTNTQAALYAGHFGGDTGIIETFVAGTGPALPALRAAGALFAAASGTNITAVIPAGAVADDVMILALMCNAGSTFTTPTDWTQFGTAINSADQSTNWFWKRHDGTEANPSSTTSATGSASVGLYGRVYVYMNCITTGTPFEDATNAGTPTSSTTPQSAEIDTTGADRRAVSFVMVDDDNSYSSGNPPATWTIDGARVSSTTGGDCMMSSIAKQIPTTATVGAVTIGTMAADFWRTMTLALLPIPSGTDATASPATVALAATIPAVTATATSTASPATAALVSTIPAATGSASHTASPATIAAVASIPQVTVTAGADPSPATIALTATIPAVTATGTSDATASPATVASTVTIPAATGSASHTASPATVATVIATPGVTVTATGVATPNTVALVATIPAVTATGSGDATPAPATASLAITIPQATGVADATPAPATVVTVIAVPQVTATAAATPAPATVVAALAIPQATATATGTASPATVTVVSAIPGVTASAAATPSPGVVAVTLTIPGVTATGASDATASPATIVLTLLIPAVAASGNVVIEVSLERTFLVRPETRTFTVAAEARTFIVRPETRTYLVEAP